MLRVRGPGLVLYFADFRIKPNFDSLFFHQLFQPRHNRSRSAHRKMDSPLAFEVLDQRVDARRIERIPADEQRLE
jgi:hypothetical protein